MHASFFHLFRQALVDEAMPANEADPLEAIGYDGQVEVRLSFCCIFWILEHGSMMWMLVRIVLEGDMDETTAALGLKVIEELLVHSALGWTSSLTGLEIGGHSCWFHSKGPKG